MTDQLTDGQRTTLRALCDTFVPAIEREPDPDGFWARTASDLGVPEGVEQLVLQIPDEQIRAGLAELLDALADQHFERAPSQLSCEQMLRNMSLASQDAAQGIAALGAMTLFLHYGAPDPQTGSNPNWKTFGYRGPLGPPADVPKRLEPVVPEGDTTLEADVCVVGSGCGGATIAGTLAQSGLKVVVLEAGGYYNESDFAQLELKAYQDLYWRGGPTPTADGNVTLQAGTTLGGGSVVNWTNCLRTTPWVREQWAREHGLEGVDGPEYDKHLDAVLDRIGATDALSDLNGPQQRMKEGCGTLGWSFRTIVRNADPEKYSPDSAAYLGFGDQSGSKLSVDKTYLLDAQEAGAEIVIRTRADRLLVENGRAAGVEATFADPESGRTARVTVRAAHVVVAAGSLESPALLMRSGIGGPAVGKTLYLHPATAIFGSYREPQDAWWGPPQAGLSDEFADTGDGYGFLIETGQYAPALVGSAVPWVTAEQHKEMLSRFQYGATFIGLTRDRGHGHVTVDPNGDAVPFYEVTDELDVANLHRGLEAQVRLHEAAGAREIYGLAVGAPRWRVGDDLEAFVAKVQRIPLRAGCQKLFSAHQMGTCRLGTDPERSVAGPWGELHDVKGVWIGDASAFPTSTGTNPMASIMALARRTAHALAAEAGAKSPEPVAAQAS